jgi:hypothetical protein
MARRIKIIVKVLAILLAYLTGETALADQSSVPTLGGGDDEVTYLGSCLEQVDESFTRWRPTVGSESCTVEEQEEFEDGEARWWCVQTLSCKRVER